MDQILKRLHLPLYVFITGACVLVVEIVAIRLLSPHYGNTIFTVSGVLTLILTALSLGYYAGGKIADRYPLPAVFYGLILGSGVLLLGFHFLGMLLLPLLGNLLPVTIGPLVSAFLLFFFPALLLGTLSPFAIKLQAIRFPEEGVGQISGLIFFWSTFGSIAGSLLSSFLLIPHFGINEIFTATSCVLFVLGLVPLLTLKVRKREINTLTLVFCGLLSASVLLISLQDGRALYSKDGLYEKIIIYDGQFEKRPARYLRQDKSASGVMFLDTEDPRDLPDLYPRYYTIYRLFNPDIRKTLVIGGGAYTIPKALLAENPDITVDVSEIEPSLYTLAQQYFQLSADDRLTPIGEDGRRYLRRTDKTYDYIYSDVYYSLFSVPSHFTTREFFQTAKEKLAPDGVFAANLIGDLSRQEPSFILSEIKTFRSVFSNAYVFALTSPSAKGVQNIMLVGYNGAEKIDFLQPPTESELPEMAVFREKFLDPARFSLEPHTTLTDNFAPVEFLTRGIFKKAYARPNAGPDGDELMALVAQQLDYGPRYLGGPGHEAVKDFIAAELKASLPDVQIQSFPYGDHTLTNIIGRYNPAQERRLILATHYDSKKIADRDRKHKGQPVPGANDSASGVAALLSVASLIKNYEKKPEIGIDFIFFDGEEGPPGLTTNYRDWKPLGSSYFAENLPSLYPATKPLGAIVIDMVCDKKLKIHKEISSMRHAPQQVEQFWSIARRVNPGVFANSVKYEVQDDHTPLNKAGIPSILLIDPKYSPFHTTQDTLDKCSGESLKTVAHALWSYVYAIK